MSSIKNRLRPRLAPALLALIVLVLAAGLLFNAETAAPAQAQSGPPVRQSLTMEADAQTITLVYDQRLAESSVPATSAFAYFDSPNWKTPSSVNVSGNEVTLTLPAAVTPSGKQILLTYGSGGPNPIRSARYPVGDTRGIAASFSSESVNWAPVLTGARSGSIGNAPSQTQVSLDIGTFSDPDGGALTITYVAKYPYHAPLVRYSSNIGRVFYGAAANSVLAGHTPPLPRTFTNVLQVVATDPDGATAASGDYRWRTTISYWTRTGLLQVDGSTLTVGADNSGLNTNTTPSSNPFTVKVNGNVVSSTVSWASSGATLTLASPVLKRDTVTLSFTNPDDQLMWAPGNTNFLAGNFRDWHVSHVKHTGPGFQGATADGTTLSISFDDPLDPAHVPSASAFTVTADGVNVPVTGVSVSNPVTLTLASAVTANQKIRVAYNRHRAGASPLQDASGELAPSFGGMPVNQPSVRGRWFTIPFHREVQHYNAILGDDNEYTASPVQGGCTTDFTVTVDGEEWPEPSDPRVGATNDGTTTWQRTSAYARCDSHTVLLHLGVPHVAGQNIATGQSVSLTYDGPILTGSGDFAGGLKYVDTDTPVPAFTVDVLNTHGSASVNGNILKIEFGVPLDESIVLDPADFEVSRGFDGTVAVLSASISGDTVTLTLAEPILSHEEVYLYFENSANTADLWDEPIQTDIRDIDGNELIHIPIRRVGPVFVYLPIPVRVLTADSPPEFARASVPANDRQVLWVAFNEDMDEASSAPGSAFTLTARSPDGATSTILGTGRAEFVARTLGKLRVHLASAPPADATLTLSYRKSSGQITDAAGVALESFADKSVNNGVPQVVGVQIVSDPGDDLAYPPGEEIRVRLTFNDAIKVNTVHGTPRLRIDLYPYDLDRTNGRLLPRGTEEDRNRIRDTGERYAEYRGGSGTHDLDFSYTVSASDRFWPRGVAVVADSLELDGAVLYSSWRSDRVALSHPGLAHDPAHLVKTDVVPPEAFSFEAPDANSLRILFNEPLDDMSVPAPSAFRVTVGGARRAVSEVAIGSMRTAQSVTLGTVTLTLTEPLLHDDDNIAVSYTAPAASEGSRLRDSQHNPAASIPSTVVHNRVGPLEWRTDLAVANLPFDSGRGCQDLWSPGNSVSCESKLSDDTFDYQGDEYRVDTVVDTHDPERNNGGWQGGSLHVTLDKAWPDELRTAKLCVAGTALPLADASFPESQSGREAVWRVGDVAHIFDYAAGKSAVRVTLRLYESAAETDCPAGDQLEIPQQQRTSLSTAATTVTAVAVTSDAGADDTYGAGDVIQVQVTFSDAVKVTGSPQIDIDMDPAAWGTKQARYASGSGTTTLTFTFTVSEPNYSSQGIAVLANTLAPNGGTIGSVNSGKPAVLSHSGLGHDADHKVDWQTASDTSDGAGGLGDEPETAPRTETPTTPSVTAVAVTSEAGSDDTYRLGDVIRITLTFSEAVDVTGSPRLNIDMDPAAWGTKWATYESGSGTTALIFTHTVVEPNFSSQGIAVLADTLELNGGTIVSTAADVAANLAHSGLAHDADHKVNWR